PRAAFALDVDICCWTSTHDDSCVDAQVDWQVSQPPIRFATLLTIEGPRCSHLRDKCSHWTRTQLVRRREVRTSEAKGYFGSFLHLQFSSVVSPDGAQYPFET